jgi:hypothetical protein
MNGICLARWISLLLLFQGGRSDAPLASNGESLVRQAEQIVRKQTSETDDPDRVIEQALEAIAPPDTEKASAGRLSPAAAAAAFRVPDGFHVSVFAGEPDVRNPIAMAWDPRGRLWVAENYTGSRDGHAPGMWQFKF